MSDCVYKKGGPKKYVLMGFYYDKLHFGPPHDIATSNCVFLCGGQLFITAGYCWDGPSGPAIDTDNFMDGSLVHDVLYELMRDKKLYPIWKYRMKADKEMRLQTAKDGMSFPRRWWTWLGVRIGGMFAARRW